MTKLKSNADLSYNASKKMYQCQGPWSIEKLDTLQHSIETLDLPEENQLTIDGQQLQYFDSAGALILQNFANFLRKNGKKIQFSGFSEQQDALIKLIETKKDDIEHQPSIPRKKTIFYQLGQETVEKLDQANGFMRLIGELCLTIGDALSHWRRFRAPNIISNINAAGIQALPIVALLSFLIGVVLAYQMGLQLQTYGANIFIAYLSGLAIFREFSPLITAIIVAGRTSSAFTAQLGSMKINEEIDALHTMGLSPIELLVMPKVIGLLLIFPLLIFWSDAFSLLGAMLMSKWMLGVSPIDFLARLKESVGLKQLMLGLYKAPAFAFIIALVGCFQGFAVKANADSIGSQTTKSVVQALFLIIIADAIYSILYSWMEL
jgi:phospholipid/cholesterol/gamma-HCH transport system permease protein